MSQIILETMKRFQFKGRYPKIEFLIGGGKRDCGHYNRSTTIQMYRTFIKLSAQ